MLKITKHLPCKIIRGQLTYLPATSESEKLKAVLCGNSYITPALNGLHTIGATHQFNDRDSAIRACDNAENLAKIHKDFPSIFKLVDGDRLRPETLEGRVGFRCTTPDYLPMIGPVQTESTFNDQYAHLAKDAKFRFTEQPLYEQGLYVNVGHGSRGLITCPLSGELIANYIENETLPVSSILMQALHPSRFLARKLVKSKVSN